MPTVAQLPGNVRIEQRYKDHNPPHFHAICGDDEASFSIASPVHVTVGGLNPGAERDVTDWAIEHRAALALNWVDALAQNSLQRIV